MSFEFTDVTFNEAQGLILDYVSTVSSETSVEVDAVEFQATGVMATWTTTAGTAPDPVITTRFTQFVPWSNIRAIRQSGVV